MSTKDFEATLMFRVSADHFADRDAAVLALLTLVKAAADNLHPSSFDDGEGGSLIVEHEVDRDDVASTGSVSIWAGDPLVGVFKTVLEADEDWTP